MENNNRRNFLKSASLGSLLLMASPEMLSASPVDKSKKITLSKDDVILFQGDSITDGGRTRAKLEPNTTAGLGPAYPYLVAAALLNNHPEKNLKIYNRGISGNKVYQLAERWDTDCLDLKPNVLSILIGVNDYWHKHNGKYDGTSKVYLADYRKLLERTKQKFPEIKLIIAEPFAVKGVKAVDETWYPEFDEYRMAAKEIAKEFNAVYIPLQTVFDKAQQLAPGNYWTRDGVHPDIPGSGLMAKQWLEVFKG